MLNKSGLGLGLGPLVIALAFWVSAVQCNPCHKNSTIYNPILPGFHPDPSCIFLPEWDNTYLCASSSFNSFPGLPLHASKDLQNWRLIGEGPPYSSGEAEFTLHFGLSADNHQGHALNRREQLPELAETNRSTSGIWAPTIRLHEGTFWITTTLVNDHKPETDPSRWDNVIFKAENPWEPFSWSNAIHFDFQGYDPEPYWDEDGTAYITGAHAWRVRPGIEQTKANLHTGEVEGWETIWEGTGGLAPEGPHIYHKDGHYYLLLAEGGTAEEHMVTIARSENINGPFTSNPDNPVLTNSNTTSLFQAVGHSDVFQDRRGNWWAVALAVRSGPEYKYFPMVRETVMTAVSWPEGEWPVFTPITGEASVWRTPRDNLDVEGLGPWYYRGEIEGDDIHFEPGSSLPVYFTHWRYPIESSYTISPEGHENTLRLTPSDVNLTAFNGNYAGPGGQTFVGRRQQDTLFTYGVTLDFSPSVAEEEAGISAFLTQNHHLDLGVVMLPASRQTQPFPGKESSSSDSSDLILHFRYRGESYDPVFAPIIAPVPDAWIGEPLRLEIQAVNFTHYAFSAGPASDQSEMRTLLYGSVDVLSWGFTGVLLGAFATNNGGEGSTPAYISDWTYEPQGQFRHWDP